MIEHATSELENQGISSSAARKFQARMSLIEARATILAATRAMGTGGFTRRVGVIAREVCGAKFGKYRPSEIMHWLRSDNFQHTFEEALENWKKSWGPPASLNAAHLRAMQYKACLNSIAEKWWQRIADAIESMLAARAQQVVLEDSQGNRRVHSLIDVLDLMFSIPMTPARSARLRVLGIGEVMDCDGSAAPE